MKALHAPITNRFLGFALKTLREVPTKLVGTAQALFVYYVVPLLWHLDLLLSGAILVPMGACVLVFLTQPKFVLQQLFDEEDGNSMKILLGATILSQMVTVTEWAYFSKNQPYYWTIASVLGISLIGAGLLLRVWAIVELGPNFDNRVHIRKDHELIVTGPYRYIRHGSYTGVYMLAIGIAVYFSAWFSVVFSVIVLGWAYRYRIVHEEKALLSYFGDAYRDYMKKTYMLIPFLL